MKKVFTSCLVLMMTLISVNVFSQMNNWALPPSTINFNGGSVTSTSIIPLASPAGISFSSTTSWFVSDQASHSIRIVTYDGQVKSFAGAGIAGNTNGTGGTAKFNTPAGLTYDLGYVYVADQGNNLIRKIDEFSGVVTTLAGSGTAGSANGTGVAASFNSPSALAIDGSGNLYVADKLNHKIRKITSAGVVTTFAGSGTAGSTNGIGTAASFNNPTGITIDGSGNLYVADNGNNLIRKITSAGVVTTFAGSGTSGFTNGTGTGASFNSPFGITVDWGSGNVFVTEKNNNSIRKITSAQVVTTFAGGTSGSANGTGTAAQFNAPAGIVIDGVGTLTIADYGNNKLRASSSSAVVSDVATTKIYSQPNGIAIDGSGIVYISDQNSNSIKKLSAGVPIDFVGGNTPGNTNGTGSAAKFNAPSGLVFDGSGNLYVADKGNHLIRKVTSAGVVTTFAGSGAAGSANGTGTAASFNSPTGLTIDGSGNIYVADGGNHLIRKITSAGVVTTLAGSGTAGSTNGTGTGASFNNPTGLVVDGSGNVYVADYGNNLIRRITSAGLVTTFAGSGTAALTNGTGTAAAFKGPYDIKLDGSGNLYVSDRNNYVIRKITSAAVVTTYAGAAVGGFQDGTGTGALFSVLSAIAINASNNLYVCDYGNNNIRFINTSAGVSTVTSWPASTYTVANAAYDQNNNVLFTVVDNAISSKNGIAGTLANYFAFSTNYTEIGAEIAIVPVPSSCRDFYVIYTKFGMASSVGVMLLYTKVSVSSTGIVTIVSNGSYIDYSGGSNFLPIAVSKLSGSNRTLYALRSNELTKYTISSSGISVGTTVVATSTTGHELELSPNQGTIAWVNIYGGNVYTVNTGGVSTVSTIPYTVSGGGAAYGIEFSDNSTLFLSISASTKANAGIYKLTTAGVLTQITSGTFGNTQLELGKDGYLYGVDGIPNYAGLLGKINPSGGGALGGGISTYVYSAAHTSSNPNQGFYTMPDQIDADNYDYFFGLPQLSGVFTINGSATSPTIAVNTFTCSSVTFGNTASTATSYQITIDKADASGNIVVGAGSYHYTPGLVVSAPAATINLQAYDASHLLTSTGYFLITFFVQDACGSVTKTGLIQNSTISPASANFEFNDGDGNTSAPQTTLSLATKGCSGGVSVNGSNSTGYIATYQITVDEVDPTSGALILANIVNTAAAAVAGGNPANIVAISLNTKSSPKNWFFSHTGTYRITYTVTNACGSSSQIGFFYIDGSCRIGKDDSPSYKQGESYPNPSNGITNITFHSEDARKVKVVLTSMQGGNNYTVVDESVAQGDNQVSFDTSSLPAGIYLYQLSDATNTIQTGKLVVTK